VWYQNDCRFLTTFCELCVLQDISGCRFLPPYSSFTLHPLFVQFFFLRLCPSHLFISYSSSLLLLHLSTVYISPPSRLPFSSHHLPLLSLTSIQMLFATGWTGDSTIDFLVGGEAFRPSLVALAENCKSLRNVCKYRHR
jgi:hypothetical protein